MTDYDIEDGGLKVEDAPADAVGVPYGNPGIERVREDLNQQVREVTGINRPLADGEASEEDRLEAIALWPMADGEASEPASSEFTSSLDAADPEPAAEETNFASTAEEYPAPTESENWKRFEAMRIAAQIHQGRGISISDIIDDAKMIEAYIEEGEVPDFTC